MVVGLLTNSEAVRLVRHCIRDGAIIPSRHFREELQNETLDLNEALFVLERGCIHDPPEQNIKTGEWKYRIEGPEPSGIWLAIVFCFKAEDTAFLITVFSIQERSRR
jgi:hypothetical protein